MVICKLSLPTFFLFLYLQCTGQPILCTLNLCVFLVCSINLPTIAFCAPVLQIPFCFSSISPLRTLFLLILHTQNQAFLNILFHFPGTQLPSLKIIFWPLCLWSLYDLAALLGSNSLVQSLQIQYRNNICPGSFSHFKNFQYFSIPPSLFTF